MTEKATTPKKTPVKTTDGFSRAKKPAGVSAKVAKKTSTKSATSSVNAAKKPPEAAEKPVVVSRGRFMDFVPGRPQMPQRSSSMQSEGQVDTRKVVEAKADTPVRPTVVRPPRSRVPRKRPVPISTARSNMPQMETPARVVQRTTIITTADGAMPEIATAAPMSGRRKRPVKITRSGAVNLPSAPTREPRKVSKPVSSRQPLIDAAADFLDDTPPLMSDADLAVALAGFADDPEEDNTPSLSDNLSKEASDFAEEIEALDDMDNLSDEILNGNKTVGDAIREMEETEDFVAEPKPLFEAGDADTDSRRESGVSTPRPNRYKGPYTIDGKSPFLTSVSVEKRPLSGAGAAASAAAATKEFSEIAAERPRHSVLKNIYREKAQKSENAEPAERSHQAAPKVEPRRITHTKETIIIAPKEEKVRSYGLIIAVILTILLGAGVGALIYLAFFQ